MVLLIFGSLNLIDNNTAEENLTSCNSQSIDSGTEGDWKMITIHQSQTHQKMNLKINFLMNLIMNI